MRRRFFYGRVSAKDQNPDRQLSMAKELEIEDACIFIDKASGKDFMRPEWKLLKRMLREGDILYVESLDRLGRNKQGILDEWKEITHNIKADIAVIKMPLLDTTRYKDLNGLETLIQEIILQLLSYMAEDERNRIKERQKEGISEALKKGVKFGRKEIEITQEFIEAYGEWKGGSITAVTAMKKIGMKPTTFYRKVKLFESNMRENSRNEY